MTKRRPRKPFFTRGHDGKNYYFNARGKRISRALYFQRKHRGAPRYPKGQKKRTIEALAGWESRDRWESYLFHEYDGITLQDNPPSFLSYAFPTEESFYLAKTKRYPPAEAVYVLIGVWFVVYNSQAEQFYLWGRIKELETSKREDELFETARGLYEGFKDGIDKKAGYIQVKEWVGWAADSAKAYQTRSFKSGKKRYRGSAFTKTRD